MRRVQYTSADILTIGSKVDWTVGDRTVRGVGDSHREVVSVDERHCRIQVSEWIGSCLRECATVVEIAVPVTLKRPFRDGRGRNPLR